MSPRTVESRGFRIVLAKVPGEVSYIVDAELRAYLLGRMRNYAFMLSA